MAKKKAAPPTQATRDRLLDAAEDLFSQQEFDAVSIRDVTSQADTPLALVHYYFRTKEEMFRQVLGRRVEILNQKRLEHLASHRRLSGDGPLAIEKIVAAFVQPLLDLSLSGEPGWKSYVRLNGRVATSKKYLETAGGIYDEVAHIFVQELKKTLVNAGTHGAEWGFLFMVSVMSGTFSESGRIERLTGGEQKSSDLRTACEAMTRFIAAGLEALGDSAKASPPDGNGPLSHRLPTLKRPRRVTT